MVASGLVFANNPQASPEVLTDRRKVLVCSPDDHIDLIVISYQ
jgi:hypothetical protein